MSCGCSKPQVSSLWSPPLPYSSDDPPRLGENISCFARRSTDGGDATGGNSFVPDKIVNTSLSANAQHQVSETLRLASGSTRTATSWEVMVDGGPLSSKLPELTLNTSTGALTGTVAQAHLDIVYKVLVIAKDAAGVIDSRELNFYAASVGTKKGGAVRLSTPLVGKTKAVITSPYGYRIHPIQKTRKMHYGIDFGLAQQDGGDVLAAHDGVVSFAGVKSGYGNCLVIDYKDGGSTAFSTLYAHLAEFYMKVGDNVRSGQKVAKEGNTGASAGLHLHFELCMGPWAPRSAVDPVPYLSGTIDVFADKSDGGDGVQGSKTTVNNGDRVLTVSEAKAIQDANNACPISTTSEEPPVSGSPPTPPISVDKQTVRQRIKAVLDADPSLGADDRNLLLFMALIESNYVPTASNPKSSAYGLFQQLDAMACAYFKRAGFPLSPSGRSAADMAMRSDVEKSTKAAIQQYKECLSYWNSYVAGQKETVIRKKVVSAKKEFWKSCTKDEIIYGVFWHDGIGSMVCERPGADTTGVDYFRKKVKQYGGIGS